MQTAPTTANLSATWSATLLTHSTTIETMNVKSATEIAGTQTGNCMNKLMAYIPLVKKKALSIEIINDKNSNVYAW